VKGGTRVQVALVCSECDGRNYKTSKRATETERIELKKFCPACNKHTIHRESK
jgi:large subunit ribosomal protein L33